MSFSQGLEIEETHVKIRKKHVMWCHRPGTSIVGSYQNHMIHDNGCVERESANISWIRWF